MRKPFATPGFCWECAVELEKNFAILQVMAEGRPEVIELRLPKTMERIGEMIGVYLARERVARVRV